MKAGEIRSAPGKGLRCHPIKWEDTVKKDGFSHLNEQLRSIEAFQFQVSQGEYGRVHGFFIDTTFFVVWMDPGHVVYS